MFLLRMFLIPYILTVLTEEIAALIWGYRSVKDLLTVLWINTVTNLSVTALRYGSNQLFHSQTASILTLIVLELAVLLCEWRLFRRFLSKGLYFFLFSLIMNAASYGAGYLLPVIMPLFQR